MRLNFGVMPTKTSKLMPGIGRDNTERYSSLKRLFTVPFSEISAQRRLMTRSRDMFDIKYGGSLPVSEMSLDDIV